MYDSELGSFTSRDPIPALNLYTYCSSNPVNFVDSFGRADHRKSWQEEGPEDIYPPIGHPIPDDPDEIEYFSSSALNTTSDWIQTHWDKICSEKKGFKVDTGSIFNKFMKAILLEMYEKSLLNSKTKAAKLFLSAMDIYGKGKLRRVEKGGPRLKWEDQPDEMHIEHFMKLFKRGTGRTGVAHSKSSIEIPDWATMPYERKGTGNSEFPVWGNARIDSDATNKIINFGDDDKFYNDAKNLTCAEQIKYLCPNGENFKYRLESIINNFKRAIMHELVHWVGTFGTSKIYKKYGTSWTEGSLTGSSVKGQTCAGSDGSAFGQDGVTGENWWADTEEALGSSDSEIFKSKGTRYTIPKNGPW